MHGANAVQTINNQHKPFKTKTMRSFLAVLFIFTGIAIAGIVIVRSIQGNYRYNKDVKSFWQIADRTSTIEKKAEYIDKFVASFDVNKLANMNSRLIFETPGTSFDQNYMALTSLKDRLYEIKDMDVSSFEYQTAMQQITAQEQGEATPMLSHLKEIWLRAYYPLAWTPYACLTILIAISAVVIGVRLIFLLE